MSERASGRRPVIARGHTRRAATRRASKYRERTIVLALGAFGWVLAFTDCPEVVEGLEAILTGWRLRRLPSAMARRADARIKKTARGFFWTSRRLPKPELWDAHPPASAMQVVCDVHDVLFDWFLQKNPRHLCLHGAAVRIGAGLVCFPSVQKSGKSTLCVALAARGRPVYGDDVLAIEPHNNRGAAFGIAPRLRKPLPRAVGASLVRFVRERAGPSDRRWIYVALREDELAPLGDAAPITAFVLLERGSSRAKLEPVAKSEMLREILLQNFARHVPPVELLDRLMRLTERVPCYRLRYGALADAVRLLERKFERRRARVRPRRHEVVPAAKLQPSSPLQDGRHLGRFRRAPGVEAREVGDEIFVAAPGPKTIHHLDRMASAAWRALAQPRSAAELLAVFRAAFPDAPARKIEQDVRKLLAFLESGELIVRAGRPRQRRASRGKAP
jgi:Coenzyme PQQ synthesis protein D (PqqD)